MTGKSLFAAVVLSVVAGVIIGSAFLPGVLGRGPSKGSSNEGLAVEGYATVKVIGPDGAVKSVWQGHNDLETWTPSGIAACLSGNGSNVFGACGSSWTQRILIDFGANSAQTSATNVLYPPGCHPLGQTITCDGWVAGGWFGPTTFTNSNCGSCTVNFVFAGTGSGLFDRISTSINVNSGDSLVVTIQFIVS